MRQFIGWKLFKFLVSDRKHFIFSKFFASPPLMAECSEACAIRENLIYRERLRKAKCLRGFYALLIKLTFFLNEFYYWNCRSDESYKTKRFDVIYSNSS